MRTDYSRAVGALLEAGFHSLRQMGHGKSNFETYLRLTDGKLVILCKDASGMLTLYTKAAEGLDGIKSLVEGGNEKKD